MVLSRACLLADRLDDLGVLVTDVDVDQLRGEVEIAVAVVVPQIAALGPGNGDGREQRLRRPRVEDVGLVELDDTATLLGVRGGVLSVGSCRALYERPTPRAPPESTTFSMRADGSLCVQALSRGADW